MNSRWGLKRGLRQGLLSGLTSTTTGVRGVLAGGLPPAEALAFFIALWASVFVSLQR